MRLSPCPPEAAQPWGPLLGVGGTCYSVRVEAPVPKKKVPQDRYSITMCRTRAKSRVTVTVATPRHQVDRYCITGTQWAKLCRGHPGQILRFSWCLCAHVGKSCRRGRGCACGERLGMLRTASSIVGRVLRCCVPTTLITASPPPHPAQIGSSIRVRLDQRIREL